MHHQEDACQFLDRFPHDKYRVTMAETAAGISRFCSAPRAELLNLLQKIPMPAKSRTQLDRLIKKCLSDLS